MASLNDLIASNDAVERHRPWPRSIVSRKSWQQAAERLHSGEWSLMGLWGESDCAHMAVTEPETHACAVLSFPCEARRFPSIGRSHAPAIRLERAMRDPIGLEPEGLADTRPWLDHGKWPQHPLGPAGRAAATPYSFLAAEGDSLHQIPVGPVHAGIIEPGHFRFTASGETVVRLEERLGYTHKGIEKLLAGKSIDEAARLAARVSGDSTVAYSLVFARAVEAALESPPPPRGLWLRAMMAELERIANHLGDVGAICNDAAFSMMHAECGILREQTLRACASAFGHRLMMDLIVPGGVAADLEPAGVAAILALTEALRGQFPELVELYENTASLQDRTVGTGIVSGALAAQFAAPGVVGRASGRAFDARLCVPYPPYDTAPLQIAARSEGDVDARVWVRIQEIQHSIGWLERALASLPDGPVREIVRAVPTSSVEGAALVEGFRGEVLGYVRLGVGRRIERCHLRDPSWLLWPLLEAAIEGNIVADFPLCNKSFNCSYSGHDL